MEILQSESMKFLLENLSGTYIDIKEGMKVSVATYMPGKVVQNDIRSNINQIWKVMVADNL